MKVFTNHLLIFFFWATISLSACIPSSDNKISIAEAKIVSSDIAGQTYYVPLAYLVPPFKSLGEDNIYVISMFSNFQPVLKNPTELLKQGEWYKNIRILADHVPKPLGNNKLVEKSIEHFKATEVVSMEYGLIHQKQPEGEIQDFKDLWIEKDGDEYISAVECSERLTKSSYPQCSHRMYWNNFSVKTSFDKRLLPEWKKIKENTLALLESFQSEETARTFLQERLETTKQ